MKIFNKNILLAGIILLAHTLPANAIKSEAEIRDELKNYITWFFTDQEKAITSIRNITQLVEQKSCTDDNTLSTAYQDCLATSGATMTIIHNHLLTDTKTDGTGPLGQEIDRLRNLKEKLLQHREKLKNTTFFWPGKVSCKQILYDWAGVLIVTVINRIINDANYHVEWREREAVENETRQVLIDIDNKNLETTKKYTELQGIVGDNKKKRYTVYEYYYTNNDKEGLIQVTNETYNYRMIK